MMIGTGRHHGAGRISALQRLTCAPVSALGRRALPLLPSATSGGSMVGSAQSNKIPGGTPVHNIAHVIHRAKGVTAPPARHKQSGGQLH